MSNILKNETFHGFSSESLSWKRTGIRAYIAFVSTISRFERKIGHVRVVGFNSIMSSSLRVKWRSSSFRSSLEHAKNTNSSPCDIGYKELVSVSKQNLDLPWPTPGNIF